MGLAVFNGDTLVGELSGIDCICHLIINNELERATISIPSPFDEEETIALEIALTNSTSKSVKLINNYPYIKTNTEITARILSLTNGIDYTDKENLKKVEEYANNYLETQIKKYLYKTSKELRSDIAGFGKELRKGYLTLAEFYQSDWLNNYENAFFDVNIKANVIDSYLFTKIS